ncbi:hypothetical protein RM780_09795 [Streptomyces sp. DSM 44917]|uniref:Uncharacterized protein n=1 Tax=Streptomyces boetiae TaxID=3075541 RepID=A0ABU2L6R6_9ACTN|nr:hypothetical protein [Streptomyces sp. DSM 44917]MDT0307254.1 hypothetical protein [Streptomyces sp. DSM 44917]
MANADLLRATLQHIEEHSEQWDQRSFRYGDQGCFAFHAARLAGAELTSPDPEVTHDGLTGANCDVGVALNDAARGLGFTGDEEQLDIEQFATRALGLTPAQDTELFHPENTLEDLAVLVQRYADA